MFSCLLNLSGRCFPRHLFSRSCRPPGFASTPLRPISLLALSLLALPDSDFPGNPLWTWESHPFKLRLRLSQTLWNPQCEYADWPYPIDPLGPHQIGALRRARPSAGSRFGYWTRSRQDSPSAPISETWSRGRRHQLDKQTNTHNTFKHIIYIYIYIYIRRGGERKPTGGASRRRRSYGPSIAPRSPDWTAARITRGIV